MIEQLEEDDELRVSFLKTCLAKLGLLVSQEKNPVPSLSRLHLSSLVPSRSSEVLAALDDIITIEDGEEYIKDDNDTFHLEVPSAWSPGSAMGSSREAEMDSKDNEDRILNYSSIVKRVVVHDKEHPASKETPYFNHHAFFANLNHFQSEFIEEGADFGHFLLYGEVVTSTNTILEKCEYQFHKVQDLLTFTGTPSSFDDYPMVSQQQRQPK